MLTTSQFDLTHASCLVWLTALVFCAFHLIEEMQICVGSVSLIG